MTAWGRYAYTQNLYAIIYTSFPESSACLYLACGSDVVAPTDIVGINGGPRQHGLLSVHARDAARSCEDTHAGLPPVAMSAPRRSGRECRSPLRCTRCRRCELSIFRRIPQSTSYDHSPCAAPRPTSLYPFLAPFDLSLFSDRLSAGCQRSLPFCPRKLYASYPHSKQFLRHSGLMAARRPCVHNASLDAGGCREATF